MKTLKRIIAVLLLFITILAVSYIVYTAKQIPPEIQFRRCCMRWQKRLNIALTVALIIEIDFGDLEGKSLSEMGQA